MPLPIGTYAISANNISGSIIISSSGTGFTGTAFSRPFVGFFDETSQQFRFLSINSATAPPSYESCTGTLFTVVSTAQDSQGNTIQTTNNILAGLFEFFPNSTTGPISPNGVFTWLATKSSSVKIKEHKEKEQSKDTKDVKDHADAKGGLIDKVTDGGKGGHAEMMGGEDGGMPAGDLNAMISQLTQRLSALEQQLAVGQSFIAKEERPAVGLHAIEEPRPGFRQ